MRTRRAGVVCPAHAPCISYGTHRHLTAVAGDTTKYTQQPVEPTIPTHSREAPDCPTPATLAKARSLRFCFAASAVTERSTGFTFSNARLLVLPLQRRLSYPSLPSPTHPGALLPRSRSLRRGSAPSRDFYCPCGALIGSEALRHERRSVCR